MVAWKEVGRSRERRWAGAGKGGGQENKIMGKDAGKEVEEVDRNKNRRRMWWKTYGSR